MHRVAEARGGSTEFDKHMSGNRNLVILLNPPGVYRAEDDTSLLIRVMDLGYAKGRRVLDIGTGSGALAIAAACGGATSVTAVDLSLRSVTATKLNSWLHRVSVQVVRGDLLEPVADRQFDLVVANPPYVPSETATLPRHRKARCWDAGPDGREVVDRICSGVRDVLAPGGDVLLVQSELTGIEPTLEAFAKAGLQARILTRARIPFGPVLQARAPMLERRGLINPGQRIENLVVIGARHV